MLCRGSCRDPVNRDPKNVQDLMRINYNLEEGSVPLLQIIITANVGTEGASENFLLWDVFKELLVTQSVLHRFG